MFPKTGNKALDAALRASSQLESLRQKGPVDPLALVLRTQQDVARLETVLQSFGYYEGRVAITIEQRSLDDPALPDAIAALPAEAKPAIAVTADLGPLYRVGEVKLEGDIPEGMSERLGIAPGAPAVAADILAGRERLLAALMDEGHALARVEPPVSPRRAAEGDVSVEVEERFYPVSGPSASGINRSLAVEGRRVVVLEEDLVVVVRLPHVVGIVLDPRRPQDRAGV